MSKFIILVSPRDTEVQLAQDSGYKTIVLRKEFSFDEIFEVDVPVEIDLNDDDLVVEKCLELSNIHDIVSVFTLNEYRIPLASKISEALNLEHCLPYEAALICRNKKMTRQKLNEANIAPVKYHLVDSEDQVISKLANEKFPLIVKPSNDSGSKNVYLCHNIQEVLKSVHTILKSKNNGVDQPIDSEVLIEEFLDGPEFSVESVTVYGKNYIIGITQKLTTPYPLSIEIGHDFPAILSEVEEAEMKKLVSDSLTEIGVDFAVTHTEVKLTEHGPKIVEINARPGGDEIPHLVKAVTGVALKSVAFHVSLGYDLHNLSISSQMAPSASIRFLFAYEDGQVSFNPNIKSAYLKEQKWHIQSGDSVKKTINNFNRLGYFIVYGDDDKNSSEIADSILDQLNLKITSASSSIPPLIG